MITKCGFDANSIFVGRENGCFNVEWEFDIKAIIHNDSQILVHSFEGECEKVDILDETGKIQATMKTGDELCIMYLSKHPRFGLCAVCSEKQADQSWEDGYYSFDGNNSFVRVTNFR